MKINYKQRNSDGYLIYICNRCRAKLTKPANCFAGKEPICNLCYEKLNTKRNNFRPLNEFVKPTKRFLMSTKNGKHKWHQHRSCRSIDRMFEKIKDGK